MDILKFEAELEVLRATNSKLIQETAKIATERQWMPFVWGAGFASAVFGIVIALIKVLH
ncbi:hypothetical protein AWB76_00902 [Caballeronia temeraria]|uniref:Uncharacterized protein n=1 Tax=Caballeronia temeraria TaxID=1777137 RepID=A0A157ZN47_9BURK|nr:hypothetical protein [Caballeronia temeraria]SAK46387.1 hypothetical protein AWB76_00902 [Caballeronia temeraria]